MFDKVRAKSGTQQFSPARIGYVHPAMLCAPPTRELLGQGDERLLYARSEGSNAA